jgi:hypothetical protein
MKLDRWAKVVKNGIEYRVYHVKEASFELDGVTYPCGAYLVMAPGQEHARAMAEDEYLRRFGNAKV